MAAMTGLTFIAVDPALQFLRLSKSFRPRAGCVYSRSHDTCARLEVQAAPRPRGRIPTSLFGIRSLGPSVRAGAGLRRNRVASAHQAGRLVADDRPMGDGTALRRFPERVRR